MYTDIRVFDDIDDNKTHGVVSPLNLSKPGEDHLKIIRRGDRIEFTDKQHIVRWLHIGFRQISHLEETSEYENNMRITDRQTDRHS